VICPKAEPFSPKSAGEPTWISDHTTFRWGNLVATFSQGARQWERESEGAKMQATRGSTFQVAASLLRGRESSSLSRGHIIAKREKRQAFARSKTMCYTEAEDPKGL
jgi:hypothetical protein